MFIIEFLVGLLALILFTMIMVIFGIIITKIMIMISPILIIVMAIASLYCIVGAIKDANSLGKELIKIIRRRK